MYTPVFGILLFGVFLGLLIAFICFIIYLILKDQSNTSKKYRTVIRENSLGDPYIGRMDTPPPMRRDVPYQEMNPNNYRGRMDTPPAITKSGHTQQFCANCGKSFTLRMYKILQLQKRLFCEHCGREVSFQ
jgi:DNA-directed RNA polymerase subunit RPC12/RpoP